MLSLADRFRALPQEERRRFYEGTPAAHLAALRWQWMTFWLRPDQRPPLGKWTHLVHCGGRGSGKTQACAAWIVERALEHPEWPINIIGATEDDVGGVMVNGPSGIIATSPPWFLPTWLEDKMMLVWPNGAIAHGFSAEKPARQRGWQCASMWLDDIAAWGPRAMETWKQAMYTLRLGRPRAVHSTTPLAMELLLSLLDDDRKDTIIRRSSTDDNKHNLAPEFFDSVLAEFAGTELEEQERFGRLVKKDLRSPFHGLDFGAAPIRVKSVRRDELVEVIVAVDPTETATATSDECGVIVMGRDVAGHIYAIEDLSGVVPADVWGERIVDACERWKAVRIVSEGGRFAELVIQAVNAAYLRRRLIRGHKGTGAAPPVKVVQAKEGKVPRAGPVRTLYVSGTLHHLDGLVELEAQMRAWNPSDSAAAKRKARVDDRLDALVHGATDLAELSEAQVPDVSATFEGLVEAQDKIPAPAFGSPPAAPHRDNGRDDDDFDRV